MRPRNREINIFNLSMLDVISGAMAAFLILIVVLLPFYRKEHIDYQAMNARLRQELAAVQARVQAALHAAQAAAEQTRRAQAEAQAATERARAAEAQAEAQRARAAGLARELARTFLVLYVRWDTRDDVDLHVIDPSGAEFYFEKKTVAGRPGELSEDNTIGPGNEVWEIRDAPAGDYKVVVELFAVNDDKKPVVVKGRAFHRDGSSAFPAARLADPKQRVRIATVTVDAQGDVTIH